MKETPATIFCLSLNTNFPLLTPFYGVEKMVLSGVIVKFTIITHMVMILLLLATRAITLCHDISSIYI